MEKIINSPKIQHEAAFKKKKIFTRCSFELLNNQKKRKNRNL